MPKVNWTSDLGEISDIHLMSTPYNCVVRITVQGDDNTYTISIANHELRGREIIIFDMDGNNVTHRAMTGIPEDARDMQMPCDAFELIKALEFCTRS